MLKIELAMKLDDKSVANVVIKKPATLNAVDAGDAEVRRGKARKNF